MLGNGASIAFHGGFRYASLYQVAFEAGLLPRAGRVFERLGTPDFEHVLLVCWHANLVNEVLGAPSPEIRDVYVEVREALINAVRSIHCSPADIRDGLRRAASFASQFDTIVTFNYDLTLYWLMMEFNQENGSWFKDGFISGSFDPHWKRLRAPFGANGATLVFYAHGSLMLARTVAGEEVKLAAKGATFGSQTDLLNTITEAWSSGDHVPVLVSEGTAADKLRAIRRSPYLTSVYDQVLSDLGGAVVIYGLSFAENDQHVVNALKHNPPKLMAISVYCGMDDNEQQAFCHSVLARLARHLPTAKVMFFDAGSAECWTS